MTISHRSVRVWTPAAFALTLVGTLGAGAPPAQAQVNAMTEVAPIVVTASRTAQTVDETLASVSVVERATIDRRQSKTMTDVLRGLPGVAIATSGGPGQSTSVFLRGVEADQTLVLIDGVKVGSATVGVTPWQNIPVEQIERVEVVRGPRSSLYGSEAIGGVIQVFTRRGEPGPLTPRLSVGAGRYNTARISGGISGGTEQAWMDASLGFEQSQGFDACRGEPFVGGCLVDQPDDDGYTNKNGAISAGWRPSSRFELDVNLLRSEGEVDYDGDIFAGDRSTTVTQVLSVRATARPVQAWTSIITAGRSWDDSEVYLGNRFLNRFDTRRDVLGWQNDIALAPEQLVTVGLDYQQDTISTVPAFAETERDNVGVYGEYLGRLADTDLQLSLRHDDNQQFGGYNTGSAAVGYGLGNGLRLTASYGTAFKAPTFNELYFPGFGNPDLDPEQSWSAELGLEGLHPWGRWSVNAYRTDIDDLIAFDTFTSAPANIDRARILGLELWAAAQLAGWNADAGLTLMEPQNVTDGPNDGNLLPRRPQQTFRVDLDRRLGRIDVGGTVFVSGRRFDNGANTVRLDGYTLVDLRAEYDFGSGLRLQGRIENVLDEDYETAAWYNQPGRSLFVTLLYGGGE